MRSFIAISFPEELKEVLAGIQQELKQSRADVKWVKPENIHLTLKFLGEIKEDLAEKICSVIKKIAQENSSFNLELSGLGAFPKLDSPRVIWLGIDNDRQIVKIAGELEKEMQCLGFAPEARRFSSHITLGRARSALNRPALVEQVKSLNQKVSSLKAGCSVERLTLFKSTLTPSGPIYEVICEAFLTGSDPNGV